jgi:HEAT repeat protein
MTVEQAIEALRSPEESERFKAAVVLIQSRDAAKQALPAVIEMMRERPNDVPPDAMRVLEYLGPDAKDALPLILEHLEQKAPDVQHGYLHVTVAMGPVAQAAVPSLMKIMTSDDFHCRYLACRALGVMGPAAKPAVDMMIERLDGDVASVRRNAAVALGRLGADVAPQAVEPLIRVLDDQTATVREAAALAMGNFGKLADPALPRLRAIVSDPRSSSRCQAAFSLWKLTQDKELILPAMLEHLRTRNMEWDSASVLAAMGPAAAPAVPDLIKALEGDPSAQMPAAYALGNIGKAAQPALPALKKMATSEEPEVRQFAEEAIKAIEE